jgi:hypothetical protein
MEKQMAAEAMTKESGHYKKEFIRKEGTALPVEVTVGIDKDKKEILSGPEVFVKPLKK